MSLESRFRTTDPEEGSMTAATLSAAKTQTSVDAICLRLNAKAPDPT
jgi:hypothetical protein